MLTLLSIGIGVFVAGIEISTATTVTTTVVAGAIISGATAATTVAVAGETIKGVADEEYAF